MDSKKAWARNEERWSKKNDNLLLQLYVFLFTENLSKNGFRIRFWMPVFRKIWLPLRKRRFCKSVLFDEAGAQSLRFCRFKKNEKQKIDAKCDVKNDAQKKNKKLASGSSFGALGRVWGGPGRPKSVPEPIWTRFWVLRAPTRDDFGSISALIFVTRRSHAIPSFLCLMCFVFQGLRNATPAVPEPT